MFSKNYFDRRFKSIHYHLFFLTLCFTILLTSCKADNQSDVSHQNSFTAVLDSVEQIRVTLNRINSDTTLLHMFLNENEAENNKIYQLAVYEKLGNIYLSNYDFTNAIDNHKKYLDVSESINDTLQILKALNLLAGDYLQTRQMSDAITHYFRAYKLFRNLTSDHHAVLKEKAATLRGIGELYAMQGYADVALNYYRESQLYSEKLNDKRYVADNLLGIGSVYQAQEMFDSAQVSFDKAINLNIELNSRSGLALSFLSMGNLSSNQANFPEAHIHLNSAHETIKNSSDKLNWMKICFALADNNIKLNNYSDAEKQLLEGLQLAKEIKLPAYLENSYTHLSELYRLQNKTDLANHYHNLQNNYAKMMNKDRITNDLLNAQIKFDKEKNIQEVAGLKTEFYAQNQRQKIVIIATIVFIVLLIVAFLIHFHLALIRKRNNESLTQLEKMKSDFYMKITHEFRTPITIIRGLAEKLKTTVKEDQKIRNIIDLEIISRQSENLLFLVNEVLSVSKIKSENKILWINDNIVNCLKYLHHSFSDFAQSKKILYFFHSSSDTIFMDYSKEHIRLIINNLLSNSIKHCNEGNKILLIVREDKLQKKCIIEIIDNGDGISEKDLPHIFKTLYKGESEKDQLTGSGIGLAFTKQLVESLGGTISAKSIPHRKTVFTIELPVKNDYRTVENNTNENISYLPTGNTNMEYNDKEDAKKPLILIAEDNRDMSFYLVSMLRDDYNLIVSHDGKEALSIANEKKPDLVISDLLMPETNGKQLCAQLKSSVATNHIPVIILTAKTLASERIETINAGADAFLTKPFIEEELKAKINQLLKSRREIREKYNQVILDSTNNADELKNELNFEFLQKVTDIIYREIKNNDFFPQGLASEMCISSSQLNRKVKSISGLNTSNYVLTVRLNRAKKLLTTSQKPIGEIAMDCGFGDFAYFSKTFKKEFGITPSKFQRMPQLQHN